MPYCLAQCGAWCQHKVYNSESYGGTTRYNIVELDGNEHTVATLALEMHAKMQGALASGVLPSYITYDMTNTADSIELKMLLSGVEFAWNLAPTEQSNLWTTSSGVIFSIGYNYNYGHGIGE